MLCENSDVELARRKFVSITLNKKITALSVTVERRKERKQFCAFSARARFHTAWTLRRLEEAQILRDRPSPAPSYPALLEPMRRHIKAGIQLNLQQLVPEGVGGPSKLGQKLPITCPFGRGEPPNEMPSYDAVL